MPTPCTGGIMYGNRYFRCWDRNGHGNVTLQQAIEKSCNVYFYSVGNLLGVDRMHKWASALGLGELSGIDLPSEIQGIMPSTEWKRQKYNEKWYAGETISVSIGQGQVSVTPISLAVMSMTVANGGIRHQPHLIRAVDKGTGKGWEPYPAPKPRSTVHMKQSTIDAVHDGLWMVVNETGTARRARVEGRDVAGKTGTAQVIEMKGAYLKSEQLSYFNRDHAWFVSYAPVENPQVAIAVLVEHGGHGGEAAAPMAKKVFEKFIAQQNPPAEKQEARVEGETRAN
jgi:penicillin-binding protein 2